MSPRLLSASALSLSLALSACSCSTHAGMTESDAKVWAVARATAPSSPLDGRAFQVDVGRKGHAKEQSEVVEFAGGRFHSRGCDPYGFGSGACTVRSLPGGAIEFESTCTSPTDGTNRWRGVVTGDAIEGAFTWAPPGKDPVDHWFRGVATTP